MSLPRLLSTLLVCVAALSLASVATAARPAKADKYDRGLIKRLLTQPPLSDEAAASEDAAGAALLAAAEACPAWNPDDEDALLLHLLVPFLLGSVDRAEPDVVRYRGMVTAMRPHAKVFKDWIAMKRREVANLVTFVQRFDGARMDVCAYLDAVVAAGDDQAAVDAAFLKLFSHPDDYAALFEYGAAEDAEEAGRRTVNKRFAAFLKASGYKKAQIAELTG